MRLLVDADSFNYSSKQLGALIKENKGEIELVFSTRNKKKEADLKKEMPQNRVYYEERPYCTIPISMDDSSLISIIHYVLNDQTTALFYDRPSWKANKIYFGPGVNNFYRYIIRCAAIRYKLLKLVKPNYVIYASTPHQIESWVGALVAEKLGIGILLPSISSAPWRKQLMNGLRKTRTVCKMHYSNYDDQTLCEEDKTIEYFGRIQATYEEAIPDYEKRRLKYNRGKHYNFFADITKYWSRPNLVYNKFVCYRKYKKLSITIEGHGFVVFFLHYQPERTTLPEGYGFTQQLLAIQALRAAIPNTIRLIVKEHPSTFTNKCTPKARHLSFYEDILGLGTVELAKIDTTPFDLIDRSIAIATISGTVAIEALLRGKPSIYFGVPVINDAFGCHAYTDMESLKDFLASCANGLDSKK